jgi:hypothetical protein
MTTYAGKKAVWIPAELKDAYIALGEPYGQSANKLVTLVLREFLAHPEMVPLQRLKVEEVNYDPENVPL